MKNELQLFIIWENARHKEKEILDDISQKFEILKTFNISWSKELFSENLSRLYGKKLHKSHRKMERCGSGDFLLIVVNDPHPLYQLGINTNITNSKRKYRQWTGGGHLIHGSDTPFETEENLIFLLHMTSNDFLEKYNTPWDGKHQNLHQEIIGTPWSDENELISFISKLPETHLREIQDTHLIVTNDVSKICRILNATKRMFFMKRNMYRIPLIDNEKFVYIRKPT